MKRLTKSTDFINTIFNLKNKGLSYKDISNKLSIPLNTIGQAISAKNKGFSTIEQYRTAICNKKGYNSLSEYVMIKEVIRTKDTPWNIITFPYSKNIDFLIERESAIPIFNNVNKISKSLKDDLNESIENLSKKKRDILRERYFGRKTYSEMGTSRGFSGQWAQWVEKEALNDLRKEYLESPNDYFKKKSQKLDNLHPLEKENEPVKRRKAKNPQKYTLVS